MKLLEFFSKNNADEQEDKIEMDLEKDLMGFILDNDELYKEYIRPLESALSKGKKVGPEKFMDVVDKGCLKFYKDKEFKKDPNEMFPVSMRKRMAQTLLKINSKGVKDENKRSTDGE